MVLLDPFHLTSEPDIKFDPLTVIVNAAPPPVAPGGEIDVKTGAGGFVTEKLRAPEVLPSGFRTVIETVFAVRISFAVMDASTSLLFTNVVERSLPSQLTTAPFANRDPMTASVKAGLPAIALDGTSDVKDGVGFVAVKITDSALVKIFLAL